MSIARGQTLLTAALTLGAMTISLAAAGHDQVKRGQEVYAAQKCQVCHMVSGKGNKLNPLDGVGGKLTAEEIRQWITNPTEMTARIKSTKKPPMPDKYGTLSTADLDALVAYLQSLK